MCQTLGGIKSRTVNKAEAIAIKTHIHHPYPVYNRSTFNCQLINFFEGSWISGINFVVYTAS